MARRSRGYSLLEILVTIAVLATLVGLLFPAIAGLRQAGRDLQSLANLRTHGQMLGVYGSDWDDAFIHFTRREATMTLLTACGQRQGYRYFDNTGLWRRAVAEDYYSCDSESFFIPGREHEGWHYLLTAAAVARPAYWNLETRTGRDQWATSRLSSVRFPGAKAAFIGLPAIVPPGPINDGESDGKFGVALLDGSASRIARSEFVQPIETGDGAFHDQWVLVYGVYGVHTPDGVLGRDLHAR